MDWWHRYAIYALPFRCALNSIARTRSGVVVGRQFKCTDEFCAARPATAIHPLPNYGAGHCLWLMRCFWPGRRASFGRDGIIHTLIKRRHTAHQRRAETSSAPWNDKRPECEIIYSRYAARLITVCHRGPSLWTVQCNMNAACGRRRGWNAPDWFVASGRELNYSSNAK